MGHLAGLLNRYLAGMGFIFIYLFILTIVLSIGLCFNTVRISFVYLKVKYLDC
jgi:Na+-transporting methylmalonyl-CoA/oxaloacetate decarboxylase gamma subunit